MSSGEINLTGVWQGLYSYQSIEEPVPFMATLLDTGRFISGATHENCIVGGLRRGAPTALIDGSRDALHVSFTKKYDGSEGWDHAVVYDGDSTPDGTEIVGCWILPEGITGHFLMVRDAGTAQEIWVKRFVEAQI